MESDLVQLSKSVTCHIAQRNATRTYGEVSYRTLYVVTMPFCTMFNDNLEVRLIKIH